MGLLDSLAGFIDNDTLAETFAIKPDDPSRLRRPLLDGIKRTREQFAARGTDAVKAASRWWQVQNGVVALTVKVGGGVLNLNDAATNHIPEPVFDKFLHQFEQAVNAGELDDALKARQAGRATADKSAGRDKTPVAGERHPSIDRDDWDSLAWAERQKVNALFRAGRNPDGSLIAVSGYKPDAPLAAQDVSAFSDTRTR
ncbi:hypothetical protein [Sphingomonas sp. Leaf231]|uniref:hypothetical protein n=1 Tax=Sphingomonas sp. Leaf231 TaxID=1736301 RepID=UPI000A778E82|nr:hypothetical protein [Sphingomonas sp. Leaf231]